jgi:putative membrane protein
MMYDWGGYRNGYDVWGLISMFLMMALVVVGIVIVLRYISHNSGDHQRKENALDILKKRYAKSEIDKKEFEEKRKDLAD